ncbi:GNAT family N-acetyltransferase [Frigoribacterium sp. CG_9.8]|uniref:GNAT family N-acetyltransferase n=1 Tax=Frigoribacterium sp. CG_9.8 TaxID=2787733 RepID=UPI0018C98D60|nr:GNAT family N-acetyltransferase [Frigoribacterium sp. CG_9.8]
MWPAPEQVETERFLLEPLSVGHAAEMAEVLADPLLYEFTGGEPPTHESLVRRYAAQTVGESLDGSQWWLNWVIRRKDSGVLIGFVQATVAGEPGALGADIAWVVAPKAQGNGVATEATYAMIQWLRERGVATLDAIIHPQHHASMAVAKNQGLEPTSTIENGEIRWELNTTSDP